MLQLIGTLHMASKVVRWGLRTLKEQRAHATEVAAKNAITQAEQAQRPTNGKAPKPANRKVLNPTGGKVPNPTGGRLVWPYVVGSLAAAGAGVYWYASRVEAQRFQLERLSVTIDGDARANKVLKILHLSDLHLSAPESPAKISFLQKITEEDYDLIFFTGDIFENYSGIQYATSLLTKQPRLGAYAVLGNHDYYDYKLFHKTFGKVWKHYRHPSQYRDVAPLVEALEIAGIQVLRNAKVALPTHGLSIIGIDYPGISPARLKEMAYSVPKEHLLLALFHMPRKLTHMSDAGIHMAFGGHTHGGQIRVPGVGALITDSELKRHEASGLTKRDNTLFHISRGISADPRTNFRLFCPPAATVIEVNY
jgi:uncharacterized protein